MVSPSIQLQLPGWMVRIMVGALLAVLCGGAGGWVGHVNHDLTETAKVNVAQDVKIDGEHERVSDLKGDIKQVNENINALRNEWRKEVQHGR